VTITFLQPQQSAWARDNLAWPQHPLDFIYFIFFSQQDLVDNNFAVLKGHLSYIFDYLPEGAVHTVDTGCVVVLAFCLRAFERIVNTLSQARLVADETLDPQI